VFASLAIAGLIGAAQAEMPAADLSVQAVAAAVRAHVATAARVDVADVELRWLGLAAVVECAQVPEVMVSTRPGEDFRGRTDFRVTLTASGEECGRFRLPARIAIWQDVAVAAVSVLPGEVVQLAEGRVSRDTIRGSRIDPGAGTYQALHAIRAGESVTDQDVILVPAVLAGDLVQLEAGRGRLRIKADAHMLNDARIGERVRVANIATGSIVSGVLTDSRTVRVGETP